jgi:hypothetical protein
MTVNLAKAVNSTSNHHEANNNNNKHHSYPKISKIKKTVKNNC